MRRLLAGLGASLALVVGAAAAQAAPGYVTTNVNLRSGPGVQYPPVVVLGAGMPLEIFGCLSDTSWCDVDWQGNRGWIAGDYLEYSYQGRRVLVPEYAPYIGLPIVTFSFNDYWGRYYRKRSWYSNYDRWGPPPRPRPPYYGPGKPPPHWGGPGKPPPHWGGPGPGRPPGGPGWGNGPGRPPGGGDWGGPGPGRPPGGGKPPQWGGGPGGPGGPGGGRPPEWNGGGGQGGPGGRPPQWSGGGQGGPGGGRPPQWSGGGQGGPGGGRPPQWSGNGGGGGGGGGGRPPQYSGDGGGRGNGGGDGGGRSPCPPGANCSSWR